MELKKEMEEIVEYTSSGLGDKQTRELQNIPSGPVDILFPWPSCSASQVQLCVLRIRKPVLQNINITISDLFYDGPSIPGDDCLFGGLAVYLKGKGEGSDNMNEIFLDCEVLRLRALKMHLLSDPNTEEIWITMYSYSMYSEMKSEIIILKTDCTGLYFPSSIHNTCDNRVHLWPIYLDITQNTIEMHRYGASGSGSERAKYDRIVITKPLLAR